MKEIKLVEIPFIKNGTLISKNYINYDKIINIKFVYENHELVIEIETPDDVSVIFIKLKVQTKEDEKKFIELEERLIASINSDKVTSLSEIINLSGLKISEMNL